MQGKILTLTKRIRATPFSTRIEKEVKGLTVYNHMILPTVFLGLEEDYQHLKTEVQVWDVSVQRQVEIRGKDARKLLEKLTPRSLDNINPSKCLYIPMVNKSGGMINDPVILKLDDERYWISIADSDVLLWVSGVASALNLDVSVFEPEVFPLAIQGPKSKKLMETIFGSEIETLKYFDVKKFNYGKYQLNIARTGWSKQGGFEVYVEGRDYALNLWDELMLNGKDLNVRPGCPNQIERIESGLLSYGSDMTINNTPYECGLGRFCGAEENINCIGAKALKEERFHGPKKIIRSFDIKGSKVPFCTDSWPIKSDGKIIGQITSGVFSPDYQTNVALGMIDINYSNQGTKVEIIIENNAREAEVFEKPFTSKLTPLI